MYSLSQCLNDIRFYSSELSAARRIISKLPEGRLIIKKKGGRPYYYNRLPGQTDDKYIRKKDFQKIKSLAFRRYYETKVSYCASMLKALEAFRNNYDTSIITPENFAEQNPHISSILNLKDSWPPEIQAWLNTDYPKNNSHPENLKFKTGSGINVRSKSECMIADALHAARFPFKYDLIKSFGLAEHAEVLSPDFVILHPITREIILWEHFGLMDDPAYAQMAAKKLLLYMESGFIPGKNLIITMESSNCPLDSATIHYMIDKYLKCS